MSEAKKSFFERFQTFMEEKLLPVGTAISNQRHLASIRDGMTILIPLTIIGGFAILLAVPPVPATVTEPSNILYAFLLAWQAWAGAHSQILLTPYYLSIGCISLYVVAGIAYFLSKRYGLNTINNVVGSLFVFLIVSNAVDLSTVSINMGMLGAGYMFGAIIIAILCVEINRFFAEKNITIKMPDSVPPNVAAPFIVLIPMIFEVVVFSLLNSLITSWTGAGITSLIFTLFQPLLKATNSLPSILFLMLLSTLFWFFGIHGDNMISPITSPIITANLAANLAAYQAGQPLEFIMAGNLAVYGGWITYHAYVVAMMFFCKSEQLRTLPKISAIPSLFNINEPNVFGVPTVLNVFTLIPSIICLVFNLSAYYLLAAANIIGKPFLTLPFTTPVAIQAFLSTMDIRNAILVVVLFFVDLAIAVPFIRAYDKQLLAQENASKAE